MKSFHILFIVVTIITFQGVNNISPTFYEPFSRQRFFVEDPIYCAFAFSSRDVSRLCTVRPAAAGVDAVLDVSVFGPQKVAYREMVETLSRGGSNTASKQHFT